MGSRNKFTSEDCEKWRKSPTVNPRTGGKLYKNAGVYKELTKQCSQEEVNPPPPAPVKSTAKKVTKPSAKGPPVNPPSQNGEYTKEDCQKWRKNKLVNPKSGRAIQENKVVYNKIKKECEEKVVPPPKGGPSKPPVEPPPFKPSKPVEPPPPKPVMTTAKPTPKTPPRRLNFTDKECEEWNKNKKVDPKTGKKVYANKGPYRVIEEDCKGRGLPPKSPPKQPPKPKTPPKPVSPVVTKTKKKTTSKPPPLPKPKTPEPKVKTPPKPKTPEPKVKTPPARSPKGKSPEVSSPPKGKSPEGKSPKGKSPAKVLFPVVVQPPAVLTVGQKKESEEVQKRIDAIFNAGMDRRVSREQIDRDFASCVGKI